MKKISAICRHFKLEMISGSAAFAILFVAFCFTGIISISGQKCILTCDLYGQYYDFLVGIRRILLEHQSLVFSWNLDMGIGLIGWIAYYVTSPFNLLLLLIPESSMIWGITVVILLKLSFSASAFTYFLKKGCGLHGIESVLPALCYGLSSFMVTYFFNIMWLDILILLPILVLNMKRVAEGESWIPFALWLSVAFFTNYYMSFMAGVFLLTCFVAYYLFKYGTIISRCFVWRFVKFAGSAIMAMGICSIVLIPTILQMSQRLGEGTVSKYKGMFNFDLADFFQSATIGSYTSLNKGQPLIYCSIFALILVLLYFLNRKIQRREKICFGILLALWIVIMAFPFMDLAMHMGNNPTCFPYRYTFVFIFLLCTAGARELYYLLQDYGEKKIFAISGIILMIFLVLELLDYFHIKDVVNQTGFVFTAVFVMIYGFLFWFLQRKKMNRKDFLTILSMVLVSELLLNSVLIFREIDKEVSFKSADNILKRQELLQKQLNQIQDNEPGYRIEKNYRVCYNDGFAYGYNSISSFSSVYNLDVHRFMEHVGIANQDWNSSYNGSTTFLDSILGIKYIFHSIPIDSTSITSGKTDYVEKNEFYLPFGFLVNKAVTDYTLDEEGLYSPFEAQQKLLIAMTGEPESGDCFASFEPDEIVYNNVTQSTVGEKLVYQKRDSDEEGSIVYNFTGDGKKEYYFYPQFAYKEDATKYNEVLTKYKTGVDSHFVERSNLLVPYNIRLFDSPLATKDTVTFAILENEPIKLNDQIFYSFDKEKYQQYYKKFQEQSLHISSFRNGFFEGKVTVSEENDILFLSVPYNLQWEISVDGEPADPIELCAGAFMGIKLDQGEHTIAAAYKQKCLGKSILLSGMSVILAATLIFRNKYKNNA